MRRLARDKPFLMAAFALFFVLTLLFGVKTFWLVTTHKPYDRAHIEPWMTVRHIARVRDVPSTAVFDILDLDPVRRDARPLGRIARDRNIPVRELIATIESQLPVPENTPTEKPDRQEP